MKSLAARALLLCLLPVAGCTSTSLRGPHSQGPTVTRAQCMALARQCVEHRWFPTAANVRHGTGPDGVRVDTPDISYQKPGAVAGWWRPGAWNTGMPYQWGGFALPEEFDRNLAAGLAAGDVYTAEKRRLLEAAVSRHATGIDCSGLVSRCWRLPRPCSTRELASRCERIVWDDLQPGDVLNTWNAHVILFTGWADAARTKMHTVESGRPPHWKVVAQTLDRAHLERQGFTPLRYRGMKD